MDTKKQDVPVANISLPKTLYGYWYEEGDTDHWINCETMLENIAETGSEKFVGVYELKEVIAVTAKVSRRIIRKSAKNL